VPFRNRITQRWVEIDEAHSSTTKNKVAAEQTTLEDEAEQTMDIIVPAFFCSER
jgi:hypothetical protein